MSKKENIEKRTWDYCVPLAEKLNLTLVDAEYVKEAGEYYLRIYIDKEGGVNIADCEAMNGLINPILDKEDYIPDAYILEVSSPGLGRVLKREHDFMFAMGKEVELHTYKAVDKQKEFQGTLTSWDEKQVTIADENGERVFDRADLSVIRLALDI